MQTFYYGEEVEKQEFMSQYVDFKILRLWFVG